MSRHLDTQCCIAGGGPAGMMAGLLLARAGIRTLVLEKHDDFLRDFRGDTIHPSTLELMRELGCLDTFLERPHYKARHLHAWFGAQRLRVADFSHLPVAAPYVAFMPQWDFLDFLATRAQQYDGFALRMGCVADSLVTEHGRVRGISARDADGEISIGADLIIAADGRDSRLREQAGLDLTRLGAPMDVLWFRLSRHDGDPDEPAGSFAAGRILILINRDTHWQCGFVIPKGGLEDLRSQGIEAVRADVARLAPFTANRTDELVSFDDLKLLTVAVNRLSRWHQPGLLVIGDAAHAMSPVGGVGINLAIQDAVAAARILAPALAADGITERDLERVQQRRMWPTRVTQRLQVAIQNRIIGHVLGRDDAPLEPPRALRLVAALPLLQRLPARLIGLGVRPEHIDA